MKKHVSKNGKFTLNWKRSKYFWGDLTYLTYGEGMPIVQYLGRPVSGMKKTKGDFVSNGYPASPQVGNVDLKVKTFSLSR